MQPGIAELVRGAAFSARGGGAKVPDAATVGFTQSERTQVLALLDVRGGGGARVGVAAAGSGEDGEFKLMYSTVYIFVRILLTI